MGKGMGPVDEHRDPLWPRHRHDVAHREDLPGEVGDVGDLDDARARRDGGRELVHDVLLRRRGHIELDRLHHDAVAARALAPGREHAPIVLVGDDDLVAPLQVEAEDHRLVGLGGVAGDRQFLRVAAELRREADAD